LPLILAALVAFNRGPVKQRSPQSTRLEHIRMRCRDCGADVRAGATTCPICGTDNVWGKPSRLARSRAIEASCL
jgi:hypothetical protein